MYVVGMVMVTILAHLFNHKIIAWNNFPRFHTIEIKEEKKKHNKTDS